MKVGIIGSAGGAVFEEVFKLFGDKHEFCVITDRPCGLEKLCEVMDITNYRLDYKDNSIFSEKAREKFDNFGHVDFVVLFFTRLVTKELFLSYPTFNIHPSILPAFKGFNPIEKALAAHVKFFGATLHLVNESVDNGPIVAQVCMPISEETLEKLNKYSFIQKTYLSLLLFELFERKILKLANGFSDFRLSESVSYNNRCNPCLSNSDFLNFILELQKREKLEVII